MREIKVAIIGRDDDFCRQLELTGRVKIVRVLDPDSAIEHIEESFRNVPPRDRPDMIIALAGEIDAYARVAGGQIAFLNRGAAEMFATYLQDLDKLVEARRAKGELQAILNAVQEGIEVADAKGVVKYVNPAFTRITGIPHERRVGQNILEASPNGALARVLISQKNVTGLRTKVGGAGVEVLSNASPIVVDGKIEGGVVVFQPMNDLLKLMEELQKSNTLIENLYARIDQISGAKYNLDDLVGQSKPFRSTVEIAKKAARSDSTVLITGESGTGKEIYAHAIHQNSNRRDKPFIKVNCAAIPESLLESEFFGYEKGAFTGAVRTKLGKVELANNGTLFLDEIGDMSLFLQAKLLRFLQEMEFERVGGTQTVKVNVRMVAATNRDLRALVRNGTFREDLYYRLNVVELHIPPLRDRREDIPPLVNHLIFKFNRKLGKRVRGVSPEAMQLLTEYDWPGNVRELENVLERAMVVVEADELTHKHLSQYLRPLDGPGTGSYAEVMPLDRMEQVMLKAALSRYGNTLEGKKKAAKALNISLATLYNKLKKLNTV